MAVTLPCLAHASRFTIGPDAAAYADGRPWREVTLTRVETVRLIVADDLTGAADACAKLVACGFSGVVLPDLEAAITGASTGSTRFDHVDVVAISTDTRRRSAAVAAERMQHAAVLAGAFADAGVFCKIDSTLRGHVAVEIAAALDAFGCSHALVAPSFPAMGRRVVDGALLVDGPGAPPPRDVATWLAIQGLPGAIPIMGSDRDWGLTPLTASRIVHARAGGARVLVFDASSDADLQAIVRAGHAAGGRPLWVGSAGLADALGACAEPARRASATLPRPAATHGPGRVLLCIGSTHPVTLAQLDRVLAHRHAHVESVSRTTVSGMTTEGVAGVVMSGGDTATDACAALGVTAIELGGEVESGVPWGHLRGGRADGLRVVVYSGGFGHLVSLGLVVEVLRRE
jgi:D-threonate/D-erythronate kinase